MVLEEVVWLQLFWSLLLVKAIGDTVPILCNWSRNTDRPIYRMAKRNNELKEGKKNKRGRWAMQKFYVPLWCYIWDGLLTVTVERYFILRMLYCQTDIKKTKSIETLVSTDENYFISANQPIQTKNSKKKHSFITKKKFSTWHSMGRPMSCSGIL